MNWFGLGTAKGFVSPVVKFSGRNYALSWIGSFAPWSLWRMLGVTDGDIMAPGNQSAGERVREKYLGLKR